MIGLFSETGRFRIRWEARNDDPPGGGAFRLTVQSGVSGRTIEVVADHRGVGSGTVDFEDDPRLYNLVVDSTNLEWSVSVEEVVVVDPGEPAPPREP